MDCWITTHWPVSPAGPDLSRHAYVKSSRAKVPVRGDLVLVYESESVTVDGKHRTHADRIVRGSRERIELPSGRGQIIMALTVTGTRRPIAHDDVVYDYGNLREWSVIPGKPFKPVRALARGDAMELLGQPRDTPPRYWSLWKVPHSYVPALMGRLGL